MSNKIPTKIIPIGGVQEIGKSTILMEHGDQILIIDAGIKFADTAQSGIKGIIPDYSYLQDKKKKIEGLFISHGHEDHIGGVVHLVKQVPIKKIYAPRIAIQYLKLKFDENKINQKIEFIEHQKSDVHRFGDIVVDYWTAQHSIPDAFGIRVRTPNGALLYTGDFRFDYNPIGQIFTDFTKIKQMGEEGVTILLSDSTNAMRPFHSPSENDILKDIEKYIVQATKKTIITAFASNLTRVTAIIELAAKLKKKVAVFGRSMVQGIKIGRKLGYINVDSSVFVDKKDVANVPEKDLLILTTGSQGEQLAALSRMSYGKHQSIKINKNDMIIFSSSPIPGNRMVIELLVNRLAKLGAVIKENGVDGYLHTSGHAYKHEHDKIFQLSKPSFFMPVHGEYRMSMVHGDSAVRNGVDPNNVIIPEMGRVYNMVDQKVYATDEFIDFGPIYIDGLKTLNVNASIVKDRIKLSENGFVNINFVIDKKTRTIIGRPIIVSRGAFYVKNSLALIEEARRVANGAALYYIKNTEGDINIIELKQLIVDRLESFFYRAKRRNPVVIPTIIFTDEQNDEAFENSKVQFATKVDPKKAKAVKDLLDSVNEDVFGDQAELEFDIDEKDEE
ncbi:ribonuclease J [Mycoplasmopsis opalescens]|uniref:ribonuclease J n=1 Tax=Mycoplasmopsis opalescens TaxID=114886 RepID=UPI0004A6D0F6|nr:ribonuclease J [Mycoplasmopsis opalescens]